MTLYQNLIQRFPTHSAYGVSSYFNVSVAAGSNWFTTHLDPIGGTSGFPTIVFVSYATATNSALELILDDGGASVNTSVRIEDTQSTVCSAGILYHYWVTVPSGARYNFSPSIGGTVITFECYEVNK